MESIRAAIKELHRVFKEAELYVKQCMESKNWWAKVIYFHNNQDGVEFHLHNLLCYFAIVVEAIETAGEISGLDVDEMKKKRIMLSNKYDMTWNDSKLFMWKFGKQYLISQDILHRMYNAFKEDQWLLLEMIKERKVVSPSSTLTKQERRLSDLLVKKLKGEESLGHTSVLTGAKDYQVRRRLGGGMQYKEIQWLGESFILRHFFGEHSELNSEISSLLSLSHPNVVQYMCGFHDEEKKEYFLVMELMSKDLNSYIKEVCGPKRRMPFSFPVAIDVMLEIAKGMEYLHSKKIYHGDLNPSNVLVKPRNSSSEGYIHAKISGFGLRGVKTVPSRNSSPNQNEILPFIWHAPEVLSEQEKPGNSEKQKYSEKADVYSFGMLCFEVLTGKVPFEDGHLQGDKMSRNIKAGERPLFPFALPKYLANLTKRCWQTDPNQRPSFSSICRILRYVKRLIVMNPNFAQPDIPSIVQVDFCDIEAGFMKKLPSEASAALTPVSQIPFQLFSYRLAEKEKLNGINKDKSWESHSEVVFSSNMDEMVNILEGSFSPAHDTKSMCLEIPEKRLSVFKRLNGISTDEQLLQTHDTTPVNEEILEKKLPILRKAKSAESGQASLLVQHAKSAFSEIPENKPSPSEKSNSTPSSESPDETAAACSVSPAKKVSDKKVTILKKSSSVRTNKDSGKANGKMKGLSTMSPRSNSARITTEKQLPQYMSPKSCRSKH
ncbi:Light-sensor Protein kinase [Bienertia sinuspersici]